MRFKEWLLEEPMCLPLWLESVDTALVEYLNKCADEIKLLAGNNTVVILGRDAWPLVPLLRFRNVKTQYFLYSRLQIGNQSTKEAWLREVPPHSLVIDTGYAGSIIDDIKTFDPTIEGLLMSSSGYYKQLSTTGYSRRNIVHDIEHSPKLINRSSNFRGHHVITSKKDRSDDAGGYLSGLSVPDVVAQNKDFLSNLGLPDDYVDNYKKFSGIPPSQRLGHMDLVTHLMDVEKQREPINAEIERHAKEIDRKIAKIYKKWDETINTALHGKKFTHEHYGWIKDIPWHVLEELKDQYVNWVTNLQDDVDNMEIKLSKMMSWDEDHTEEIKNSIKLKKKQLKNIKKINLAYVRTKMDDYYDKINYNYNWKDLGVD